jgi:hypothetical protein
LAQAIIELLAVLLISLASFITILVTDWRVTIGCLAIQYAGVFLLVGIEWPLALSVTTLIAGWLSGVILGMAMISLPKSHVPAKQRKISARRSNPLFNFLAALLIYMAIFSQAPQVQNWLPFVSSEQSLAALTLIGMGMLRLALDPRPLSTTAAILALLSGFEIIYASMTSAQFAVGALAVVTLFIALAGSYLILSPLMEETG